MFFRKKYPLRDFLREIHAVNYKKNLETFLKQVETDLKEAAKNGFSSVRYKDEEILCKTSDIQKWSNENGLFFRFWGAGTNFEIQIWF